MRIRTILTVFAVLLALFSTVYAQQNEDDIARALADRLASSMDFGIQKDYRVMNPDQIYFDVDEAKKNAILYFKYHPIYRFQVRIVDRNSGVISIAGAQYVLTGNTGNGIILDKAAKKVIINDKMFASVTWIKTPQGKIRFLLKGTGKVLLKVRISSGKGNGDFRFGETRVLRMSMGPLKVGGNSNPTSWYLQGNISKELFLNTSRKILYFRTGHPRGTWSQLQEI